MECFKGKKKKKSTWCGTMGRLTLLADEVRFLQGKIKGMIREKEKESKAHEKDRLVFAFKEAEWNREKKKLKEEVKRLRKTVEENNERRNKRVDDVSLVVVGRKNGKEESPLLGTMCHVVSPVEVRAEERLWRDEAVEKWKKLYLAIKIELDDLIQTTHRDGLHRRTKNEHVIEELKMEVKSKEATIEKLKARLVFVEKEEFKRAREVDILRQSLRIISSRKASSNALCNQRIELVKATKNLIQEI